MIVFENVVLRPMATLIVVFSCARSTSTRLIKQLLQLILSFLVRI